MWVCCTLWFVLLLLNYNTSCPWMALNSWSFCPTSLLLRTQAVTALYLTEPAPRPLEDFFQTGGGDCNGLPCLRGRCIETEKPCLKDNHKTFFFFPLGLRMAREVAGH